MCPLKSTKHVCCSLVFQAVSLSSVQVTLITDVGTTAYTVKIGFDNNKFSGLFDSQGQALDIRVRVLHVCLTDSVRVYGCLAYTCVSYFVFLLLFLCFANGVLSYKLQIKMDFFKMLHYVQHIHVPLYQQ